MTKFLLLLLCIFAVGFLLFTKGKNEQNTRSNTSGNEIAIMKTKVDETEDASALGYSGQNKLAVDSEGNIYAAYRKKIDGLYEIFVAKLDKNKKEEYDVFSKTRISHSEANQRVPSLVIDTKGTIHIVWYGADSSEEDGDRQIKYANSQDGGKSWSDEITISDVERYNGQDLWQEHPTIVVGENNMLYIVWEGKDENTNNQQIKFSKSSDDGETWSAWINIKPSGVSQSRPTIIQSNGILYVFMYSKGNVGEMQVWYTTSEDNGKKWSTWKNISNSKNDARHLHAAIDSENAIHLVWREYNPENMKTTIMYSQMNNKNWTKPFVISESNSFQYFPQVGIDNENTVFVTWVETTKKSNFPEEDPKEGISYMSFKKLNTSSFAEKHVISEDSYYPNIIINSPKKGTDLLYAIKDDPFSIFFAEVSL